MPRTKPSKTIIVVADHLASCKAPDYHVYETEASTINLIKGRWPLRLQFRGSVLWLNADSSAKSKSRQYNTEDGKLVLNVRNDLV